MQQTQSFLHVVKEEIDAGKAVLIDIRESEEIEQYGALLRSSHYPFSLIAEGELPKLPEDKKIYLHCASGVRVRVAAHILSHFSLDVCPLLDSFEELALFGL